jgi:hypothetical protein
VTTWMETGSTIDATGMAAFAVTVDGALAVVALAERALEYIRNIESAMTNRYRSHYCQPCCRCPNR